MLTPFSNPPIAIDSELYGTLQPTSSLLPEGHSVQSLMVVDGSLNDLDTLMAGITADAVVVIDPSQDGMDQVSQMLSNQPQLELDSLQILSHGDSGTIQLGTSTLNAQTLSNYSDNLIAWGNSLASTGDVLLYGCNVGAGDDGQAFVQTISNLTKADVAASKNLTGQNGDWILELKNGEIEATPSVANAVQSAYQHTLNLVQNSGFEDGLGAWTTFTGSETVSTSEANEGGQSLELKANGSGAYQAVSATAGETYILDAYTKTASSDWSAIGIDFWSE
ncbi:MAG: DUF4347 domain-containing protein, partial [Cyanobacteria bacterium P01_F01_bin.150]